MGNWQQLLYLAGIILVGYLIYRMIKGRPEMFSKANISKSFTTMAYLALILIGFISLCVYFLRR